MKKILLFIFWTLLCQAVAMAQECRDFKPDEQKVYAHLLQVFDESVKNKFNAQEWNVSLKNPFDNNTVVNQKMLPERPFAICGAERLNMSLVFPWYQKLSDSSKAYDDKISAVAAKILNGAAVAKTLAPLQKQLHALQYKQSELSAQQAISIVTGINEPFLILSSPHGGSVPISCKKIVVPGTAVAYLLKFHDDDIGDHYQTVIGLGKWTDNIKIYNLENELYNHYHFANRYPTTVIENLTFTVTSGRMQDVMDITNKIDWAKMNQALTN